MKLLVLIIAVTGISLQGFSQTKRIAHRSHSGNNSTFSIAGPDNFGETPEMNERRKKQEKLLADSIAKKAIADSIARKKSIQPAGNKKKKKTKN